jgi:hypothetical protein
MVEETASSSGVLRFRFFLFFIISSASSAKWSICLEADCILFALFFWSCFRNSKPFSRKASDEESREGWRGMGNQGVELRWIIDIGSLAHRTSLPSSRHLNSLRRCFPPQTLRRLSPVDESERSARRATTTQNPKKKSLSTPSFRPQADGRNEEVCWDFIPSRLLFCVFHVVMRRDFVPVPRWN